MTASIGDLASFITSGSRGWAKYYSATGRLFLRIQNVRDGKLELDDVVYVDPPDSQEAKRTTVQAGDVLLSITADLGRTAVVPDGLGLAHINQHLAIIRLSGANPHFVAKYLASPEGQRQFEKLNREGVKAGLNFTDVRSLQIPLPPLDEQRRIASILDAADALRAKRREALVQLDTLLQSTFLDMFGDPVTNPMGWEVARLGEIAGFHAGSTLPAGEDFAGQERGFLYLKVGDLNHPLNSETVVRSNIWGADAKKGITAPRDAVVIPKRGGAIGTNKKRLLSRDAVLDPNLMAISASEFLDHVYLYRWFHTFDLMSITSGSTVPQLNKRDLAPLRIPLPPLDQQQRFATIVESVERQKTTQRAHLAELDTLFAALQSRAFRGDL